MKENLSIKNLLLTGGVFIAFSCSDTPHVVPETELSSTVTSKVIMKDEVKDKITATLAKNLASGMSSANLRGFLKAKATEKFDGDLNFLIETTKTQPVEAVSPNGRSYAASFGDILTHGSLENTGARVSSTGFLDSVSALYPLLQIAIPDLENTHVEDWDVDNEVPLVAFLPSDLDEDNLDQTIVAYDFEGNEYLIDASEEPEKLVIIISENERLFAYEKSATTNGRIADAPILIEGCGMEMQSAYHETSTHIYFMREDVYEIQRICDLGGGSSTGGGGSGGGSTGGGGSGGGSTGGGTSNSCQRESNDDKDYLNKARFKDMDVLRKVEKWYNGNPEVVLRVSFAKPQPTADFNFTGITMAVGTDGWHKNPVFKKPYVTMKGIGSQIVRWDPETYGDRMYYSWIEEDVAIFRVDLHVDVTSTFNFLDIPIANVVADGTASFEIGNSDDIIVSPVVVEYCEATSGEGTEYEQSMHFWIHQR